MTWMDVVRQQPQPDCAASTCRSRLSSHGGRFSKCGEDVITLADLSNEYRVGVGCVSSVASRKAGLALAKLSGSRISCRRIEWPNRILFIP
jgi:hypothetical protein